MNKQEWQTFVNDKPARDKADKDWLAREAKLSEAEKLLFNEHWKIDYSYPGLIYCPKENPDLMKLVDIEVWAYMRALMRGLGEASIRRDKN